jgi:hypothetical protein
MTVEPVNPAAPAHYCRRQALARRSTGDLHLVIAANVPVGGTYRQAFFQRIGDIFSVDNVKHGKAPYQ